MSKPVRVYVCSEDYTSAIGTAEVVECYLEDEDDPTIILRDVSFDAEQILSGQVRALEHDIEYYKQARDAERLKPPEPVPGPTLTVSESKHLFDIARQGLRYWPNALDRAGITVVPDPEPTEAEKLETLIDGHINVGGITPKSLAEYLTAHGVTV